MFKVFTVDLTVNKNGPFTYMTIMDNQGRTLKKYNYISWPIYYCTVSTRNELVD